MTKKKKCLTEFQLKSIDLSKALHDIAQLEFQVTKLRQQVIQLKAKNLELITQLKVAEITEAQTKVVRCKDQHTQFMDNIKKELDISAVTWGYDPLTGEIAE